MIELTGEKTILRTLERTHCRQLMESFEPVEPLPTERLRPGLSIERSDKWFEEMQARQEHEQLYLGIFTPKGELLGDIQLFDIDWRQRTAKLGFGLSRQQDRGKGYGTDASRTLLRYAFDHMDLWRVSAHTYEYNNAAQRCFEKLGFVQEGRERQVFFCGGRRWDRLRYGLLRTDFATGQIVE